MKPIINPWWIYLAEKSETLRTDLLIFGVIAAIVVVMMVYVKFEQDIEDKIPRWLIIIAILGISMGAVLPSQKTVLTMMTLNQLTENNIKAVGETVEDTIDYIVDKVEKIIDEEE